MIKVVIIDDEPVIVKNIQVSIQSANKDFQVIGSATDGKTGLELVCKLKPDLVFADICMPIMNGLELVECLRERENQVPVVILSGYKEFEYAKRAMQLGVIDYLVKPLNPMTLEKFLLQLKTKLLSVIHEKKQLILEQTIHLNVNTEEMETCFEEDEELYLIKICIGAFNFFRNNQFGSLPSNLQLLSIRTLCEKVLQNKVEFWVLNGKYDNERIIVVRDDADKVDSLMSRLYESIKEAVQGNTTVTFVATRQACHLSTIREEISNLESQLYYRSIYARSNYFLGKRDISNNLPIEEYREALCRIEILVKEKQKEKLTSAIRKVLLECEVSSCTQAKLVHILKSMMQLCSHRKQDYDMDFMLNLAVINATNYKELYTKVTELFLEYAGMEDEKKVIEKNSEEITTSIQTYLDEHYQEKILIQEVADKFGFNYSYLCSMFRKYKNISPNEYIIEKRIEKAKKLLHLQEDLSVKEIAALVGYQDQYYFSRIFKTNVGVTPSAYKRRKEDAKLQFI